MKIFQSLIYVISVSLISISLFGQDAKTKISETAANLKTIKIDTTKNASKLIIIEEPDIYRTAIQFSDSSEISKNEPVKLVFKSKVRLDANEIKAKIPSVVYEYPDGTLEIDYDALVSIIFLQFNEYSDRIKILEEELKKLQDAKVKN